MFLCMDRLQAVHVQVSVLIRNSVKIHPLRTTPQKRIKRFKCAIVLCAHECESSPECSCNKYFYKWAFIRNVSQNVSNCHLLLGSQLGSWIVLYSDHRYY